MSCSKKLEVETDEANLPVFWKKGDATRAWAMDRSFDPEEMTSEGQAVDVSWGDVASACIEVEEDD